MLFLRMGSRLLVLETGHMDEIKTFLIENLNAIETEFSHAMEEAAEDSCFVFLTDSDKENLILSDGKVVLLINQPISNCLAELMNKKKNSLIRRVIIGPSYMLMRIAGDEDAVKKELISSFTGKVMPLEDAINNGKKTDTILFLTRKALSKPVKSRDVLGKPLLIPYPSSQVYKRLSKEGLLFITRSLEDRRWFEYRINIYDSKGKFNEHYRRLNYILTQLDIGMVIEENWTRDHALMLFSVAAYQVRLISAYPPEALKKILMGLEYDDSSNRLVDMDLYYRNKKISWVDIDKKKKKKSRKDEGAIYRRGITSRLSEKEVKKLLKLEEDLK